MGPEPAHRTTSVAIIYITPTSGFALASNNSLTMPGCLARRAVVSGSSPVSVLTLFGSTCHVLVNNGDTIALAYLLGASLSDQVKVVVVPGLDNS